MEFISAHRVGFLLSNGIHDQHIAYKFLRFASVVNLVAVCREKHSAAKIWYARIFAVGHLFFCGVYE